MDNSERLAKQFEACRGHLREVAYRMLGSASEADDAVQEAWLRLCRSDPNVIENIGGWLTTVVARVCLDTLRSRKVRAEQPIEAEDLELPARGRDIDVEREMQLADSVGLALLVLLDRLEPAERLAYVLHEMFDLRFDEIARIVERTPAAARKLASRARQRLRGIAPPSAADRTRQRELADAFLSASRAGNFGALLELLDPDVVLHADAAAVRSDTAVAVRGSRFVARRALAYSHRAPFSRLALVNGRVGIIVALRGRLLAALNFTVDRDRITTIDVIADPAHLERLELAQLDA